MEYFYKAMTYNITKPYTIQFLSVH